MRVTSKTRPHLINTNKTQQNNKKEIKKKKNQQQIAHLD
jgi:hypothetical protein